MCNLYSQTRAQAEVAALAKVIRDNGGNLPPMPAVFPDQLAPIVRETLQGRELVRARWGVPGPASFGGKPITNIRNTSSRFWAGLLKPERRCLVPATSFCEYTDNPDAKTGKKTPVWFALDKKRPLFFFAGVWREWQGTRGTKADPAVGSHLLFSFLTTDANKIVAPIHPKAMPVMLTKPEEFEQWLKAPIVDALKLQRPLPDKFLQIVASGEKKDG